MSNLIGFGQVVRTTEHVAAVGNTGDPCVWAQQQCASRGGSLIGCNQDPEEVRYSCGYDFLEKDIPPTFVPPPTGGGGSSGGTATSTKDNTMYAGVKISNWLLIAGAAAVLAYVIGAGDKDKRVA